MRLTLAQQGMQLQIQPGEHPVSYTHLDVYKRQGQYVITPDNGTLTHVTRICGIAEARVIDESFNRLPGSGESYTCLLDTSPPTPSASSRT